MESWTMQSRLKQLWVREKKKKQRSKIINFYYCESLCYLTAGNSKHNIQTPKARRRVELGGKKKQWACWIILRPLLITSNVVEGKVSARRRDNFRNEFIFLKSNRSICGKYKRQSRGLLLCNAIFSHGHRRRSDEWTTLSCVYTNTHCSENRRSKLCRNTARLALTVPLQRREKKWWMLTC